MRWDIMLGFRGGDRLFHSSIHRAALFCCCLATLVQSQAQPQPAGRIAGIALDHSDVVIRHAIVTLSTVEKSPQDALAWTDSDGRFSFSYLLPGRYQLRAHKNGYQGMAYGAKTPSSPAGTLELTANENRGDIVLHLQRMGSISGAVLGDDNEPIPHAQVMAMRPDFVRQKRKLVSGPSTITDSDGRYHLTGLGPGEYAVVVTTPHRVDPKLDSVVSASQPQAHRAYSFGPQYYPGVERAEEATLFALKTSRDLMGIDFRLIARPTVTLAGKVLTPAGFMTTDHVSIKVRDEEFGANSMFETGAAPPAFGFEVDNFLIPGTYLLTAQATVDGKPYRGVQQITIGPLGLRDLAIPLEPGIDLVGSVSVEGPDAAKHPAGYVALTAGDGIVNYGPALRAAVNKDGSFKITGVVPGIWDIDAGPIPAGGYIKSMLLGDRDVLTEDMVIRPTTTGVLKIVLSTRAATLEGDVVQGEQPSPAMVVLAPEGKLSHVASFYRVSATDEKGHFEIKNAVPGRYMLYAFDEFDRRLIQDPGGLKRFEESRVPVTLSEGANGSRKLSVLSGAH